MFSCIRAEYAETITRRPLDVIVWAVWHLNFWLNQCHRFQGTIILSNQGRWGIYWEPQPNFKFSRKYRLSKQSDLQTWTSQKRWMSFSGLRVKTLETIIQMEANTRLVCFQDCKSTSDFTDKDVVSTSTHFSSQWELILTCLCDNIL